MRRLSNLFFGVLVFVVFSFLANGYCGEYQLRSVVEDPKTGQYVPGGTVKGTLIIKTSDGNEITVIRTFDSTGLSDITVEPSIDALKAATNDKDEDVRKKSKEALEDIDKIKEQTTLKCSMSTPRMASAFASVGEKIYIIGGMTKEGKVTSIVEQYDPSTDKWTKMSSIPTPRYMTAAVAVGKTIYVIGGLNESGVTNVVEVYDTVLNSWKKVKSISQPRWNHMVAEVGGKIYVIGGIIGVGDKRQVTDKVEIYNPQKDLWSTGHPMPAPKQGAAVAVVQGKIYIISGRVGVGADAVGGSAINSVEIYDPHKNTWSSAKQKMQEERTGAKTAVVDGKIYVIGGAARDEIIKPIEVYGLATDAWTTSKFSLQKPRTGHSVASVGGKIYIIGGAIEESLAGIVGTVEELIVEEKRSKGTVANVKAQLYPYISLCEFPDSKNWPRTIRWEADTIITRTGCSDLEKTLGHPSAIRVMIVSLSDSDLEIPIEGFNSVILTKKDSKKIPAIAWRFRQRDPLGLGYSFGFATECSGKIVVIIEPQESCDLIFLFPSAKAGEFISIAGFAPVKITE